MKLKDFLLLIVLTLSALFIHGYHPAIEDSEIYLSGIEKALHPELFPLRTEFFASHAHLSLYAQLIAASVRFTHLPLSVLLFAWHLLSIFLLFLAAWELAGKVFGDEKSRWAAVGLLAATLTLVLGAPACT